jgi:hypothetical protein
VGEMFWARIPCVCVCVAVCVCVGVCGWGGGGACVRACACVRAPFCYRLTCPLLPNANVRCCALRRVAACLAGCVAACCLAMSLLAWAHVAACVLVLSCVAACSAVSLLARLSLCSFGCVAACWAVPLRSRLCRCSLGRAAAFLGSRLAACSAVHVVACSLGYVAEIAVRCYGWAGFRHCLARGHCASSAAIILTPRYHPSVSPVDDC